MKIKNDKGEEIEVFTQAEMEAKSKEVADKAIEDYKKNNPDKTKEISDLKSELEKKDKELEDAINSNSGKEDTPQIKRLRQERDDFKKKAEDAQEEVRRASMSGLNTYLSDVQKDAIRSICNGDSELMKKVEQNILLFSGDLKSKDDIITRVENAYKISIASMPKPGAFDRMNTFSKGGDHGTQKNNQPGENEVAMGNVLGITEADRKKYGNK